MGRRSIKIEIPLPSGPALRSLRFSLKSFAALVAVTAAGMAIFNYATEWERAKHSGVYVSYVVTGPTLAATGTIQLDRRVDLASFVSSQRSNIEQWPPTIWIKRVDITGPELEKRIDIACGGTLKHPTYREELELRSGDVVFIDAGRMKTTAGAPEAAFKVHGVAINATKSESTLADPSR